VFVCCAEALTGNYADDFVDDASDSDDDTDDGGEIEDEDIYASSSSSTSSVEEDILVSMAFLFSVYSVTTCRCVLFLFQNLY